MDRLIENVLQNISEDWVTIVRDFKNLKNKLPNPRRALIYLEKLAQALKERPPWLDSEYLFHLLTLFSSSNYLADFLVKNPSLLPRLKDIYRRKLLPAEFYLEADGPDRKQLKERFLSYKNLHMARVVLRDLLSLAPFTELVRDVTLIHDSVIKAALNFLWKELLARYGEPTCGFTVIDMGKAAGFELNYSSDIDLMFVYESRFGETSGGKLGRLQNHDFFTLLARELLDILNGIFVVDTRLRPNGTMGPLVNDILALEEYYTAVARPWERFALLKSRPSAGDLRKTGIEFVKLAKAFVYRKYIDLTLIEEVLRLKELIKQKVLKKRDKIDLKLGKGGIREIEFIVQAFQLIYGGKHREIRSMHTLIALKKLHRWGYLTDREYSELRQAYLFLRRAEHMLQITNFRQTQTFHPESEEAEELARKMGFSSREEFLRELRRHMERVNYYFNRFFPTGDRKPLSTFTGEELAGMGFVESGEVKRFIDVLLSMKSLTPEELNRIDVMGELFLKLLYEAPSSKNAMKNLVNFLEKKEGRVFFFSILNQLNALNLLFYLLSTKEFFISRFRQTPELVDYIFQPRLIEEGVNREVLREFLEDLRNLKLVKNIFEVVALLRLKLKRSSIVEFFKELTVICDFVLEELYRELSPSFCLSSLGKHGSCEMNVGSDLDLLFSRPGTVPPEEEKAVRLIKEVEELGYEVDTRLRPFGEKGELIFTLGYFRKYLKENARVWERLAFTRFRFLLGTCRSEIEETVREFLFARPLDPETLSEIEKMRQRLERELGRGRDDIKYSAGGVVDLEFIAYTYQLLRRRWLRNTYRALLEVSQEVKTLSHLPELYIELREAETEKRLFGEFIFYGAKIEDLKKRVRESYREFFKWCRKEISENT